MSARRGIVLSMLMLLAASSAIGAESSIVGQYTGSLAAPARRGGADRQWGIVIDIRSAEAGKLSGTLTNSSQSECRGQYPAEGWLKGDQVHFQMTETREIQGCAKLLFQGFVEGDKLVGKMRFNDEPRELILKK